jgi:hypothetical protein
LFSLLFQVIHKFRSLLSYQAVIRDNNGNPIQQKEISMQISTLQGDSMNQIVYQETQHAITSPAGHVDFEIGNGIQLKGVFSKINWGLGKCFIQTALDITGGDNYILMGTSPILSVPYS